MKLLIKLSADVTKANATGSTPLHAASLNGYGESMEILIERGKDIHLLAIRPVP
jgi:ankyrin repeat protein